MTPRAHLIPEVHAWCVVIGTERVAWQTACGTRSLFATRDDMQRFLRERGLRIARDATIRPREIPPREWRASCSD